MRIDLTSYRTLEEIDADIAIAKLSGETHHELEAQKQYDLHRAGELPYVTIQHGTMNDDHAERLAIRLAMEWNSCWGFQHHTKPIIFCSRKGAERNLREFASRVYSSQARPARPFSIMTRETLGDSLTRRAEEYRRRAVEDSLRGCRTSMLILMDHETDEVDKYLHFYRRTLTPGGVIINIQQGNTVWTGITYICTPTSTLNSSGILTWNPGP